MENLSLHPPFRKQAQQRVHPYCAVLPYDTFFNTVREILYCTRRIRTTLVLGRIYTQEFRVSVNTVSNAETLRTQISSGSRVSLAGPANEGTPWGNLKVAPDREVNTAWPPVAGVSSVMCSALYGGRRGKDAMQYQVSPTYIGFLPPPPSSSS